MLRLGGTADGAVVATERHALLVRLHILKVRDRLGELEVVDSSCGLAAGSPTKVSKRPVLRSNGPAYRVFLKCTRR